MDDDTRAVRIIAAVVLGILMFGGVSFWYLKTNTYTETGRVVALTWQRDITVNVLRQLEETAEVGFQPSDAYDLVPYTYTWTTYYEICTGTGKNETCMSMPEFHSENRYRYHVNRWVYDHTLRSTGTPHDERLWPDFTPSPTVALGAQQEAGRAETFYVAFKTKDGKTFTLPTAEYAVWHSYGIETDWTFQVNRFEEPQWQTIHNAS